MDQVMVHSDSEQKRTVLSIKIKNKSALYSSFMSFVQGKGLFIPTKQKYALGDLVHLRVELLETQPEYELSGKVVWTTPLAAQGNRMAGIGVQLAASPSTTEIVDKIERELADMLGSDQVTHTM